MKFEYIISIGFFCSVAKELERKGFREFSLPFDWVISDIESIISLIQNQFSELFKESNLYYDNLFKHIVKHKVYRFDFYHEFTPEKKIAEQIPIVKEKYDRRIERFYNLLLSKKNILFVRYMLEDNEYSDNAKRIDHFIETIKGITPNFRVLLIKHSSSCRDIDIVNSKYLIKTINVEKDRNDYVCRKFFDNKQVWKEFLSVVKYSPLKRIRNLLHNVSKKTKRRFCKTSHRDGVI